MSSPERLRFETFNLGSDEVGGVVHLRSRLPEVIAVGTDAALEFMHHTPPMGGDHASWINDATKPAQLVIETPECMFAYQVAGLKTDSAGWYFVMRRVWVSETYSAWVETL